MYIVHVFVHVNPDAIDDFKRATMTNAKESVQEPGRLKFTARKTILPAIKKPIITSAGRKRSKI